MRNRAAFLQWVGRMSPPSLPFYIVHLECGDLVIIVISEEEFHDGVVVGCGGTPGERGRRCPCSRWRGSSASGGSAKPCDCIRKISKKLSKLIVLNNG